jgi:hypothetical protein
VKFEKERIARSTVIEETKRLTSFGNNSKSLNTGMTVPLFPEVIAVAGSGVGKTCSLNALQ